MIPRLKGRVLFVFSDSGGAKPCLSLIEENNFTKAIAISNRYYPFYKDFKTNVSIVSSEFEQYVELFNPDLIFTGTSYTSDIERQFIKIAINKNIKCYSFVDHWTSFVKRFQDENDKLVLPDQVWVIDERARLLAIEQGINESKLVISGNPYHRWLKRWKPNVSKVEFFIKIGLIFQNQKIILYAPDPLSNIDGIENYGFDEITATRSLIEIFSKNKNELNDYIVLVKMHPNQDRKKLEAIISKCKLFYLLPEDVDTNLTIYFSNIVIGFFSSFLIESSIIGKPVLRYFDEYPRIDPFENFNIGTIVIKETIIPIIVNSLNLNKKLF